MRRLDWPKQRRLLNSAQFQACYEQGEKLFTRHFVCFVLPRADASAGFRLGLTVSRKLGKAVARNRIKRVVREFFRLRQQTVPDGLDIVVVPKRTLDASRLDLDRVATEFTPLLARMDVMRARAGG
ncbi:MAG: ribonuclease P protein component [Desulfovibrionaceae bacterium]